MRRVIVGIVQNLLCQSLGQEVPELLLCILLHARTIRRHGDPQSTGLILHHAERPDLAVKGLFLTHSTAGFSQHGTGVDFTLPEFRCVKGLFLTCRCKGDSRISAADGFHSFRRQHRQFPEVSTVKTAAKPAFCTGLGGKDLFQHNRNQSMGTIQPNSSGILPHWIPVRVS